MAKLKDYNGHYCESDFEYAFIGFLENEGWKYISGNKINRETKNDVLIKDDFILVYTTYSKQFNQQAFCYFSTLI